MAIQQRLVYSIKAFGYDRWTFVRIAVVCDASFDGWKVEEWRPFELRR